MLEGGCQAHRVGYFGSAMICKKLTGDRVEVGRGQKRPFLENGYNTRVLKCCGRAAT